MLAISQVLRLRVLLVAGLIAVTSFSTASAASNFTTIDVTGAGTGALQGTAIVGIDTAGDVAGIWLDSSGLSHGFVRSAAGTITKFDVTGAGTVAGEGTFPTGMDTAGNIVGTYRDAKLVYHGFVRAASTGTITTFDVTGAGTNQTGGYANGTKPFGINATAGIVGYYVDANYVFHGFLRATNGTITNPLNAPDAGTYGGTQAFSINDSGEIAGLYYDSNQLPHGFVRSASGTFTEFNVPGGNFSRENGNNQFIGIFVMSIDAAGDVAGSYYDTNFAQHGFLRAANGTYTTLDAPGASTSPCPQYGTGSRLCGTFAVVLDAVGDIIGGYADSNGIVHGFVRPAETGIITSFDDPGAGSTGSMQGTLGFSLISSASAITIVGTYADTNSVLHGFIYTPALATTTTTLTPAPTPNPSIYGEPVTLTAAVTSAAGAPPNGESITFLSGTTSLGTKTLSSGVASLTTTALLGGTDSITAVYGGDADFAGSTSTAVSQVVNKATSSTSLISSLNPSTYGQSVNLTASVSGQFGGIATGTMMFSNGSTSLGSVSLSGGSAVLATTALPVGTDSISAVYGGDTNYAGNTSNSVSQVVNNAPPTSAITITSILPAPSSAGIIHCNGDSLTAAGLGITYLAGGYCTQMGLDLGLQVYSDVVGGDTSTQIGVRNGGVPTYATVVGGVIPACTTSGSCTGVTVTFPTGYEPITINGPVYNWSNCTTEYASDSPCEPGTIAGVTGVLTISGSTITFTPNLAGSQVITSGATFYPTIVYPYAYQSIWAGVINYTQTAQILSDDEAMVAKSANLGVPSIVLSVIPTNVDYEWYGGYYGHSLPDINNALAAQFGAGYADVLGTLINYACASPYITDQSDCTHHEPPTSLRAVEANCITTGAIGADDTSVPITCSAVEAAGFFIDSITTFEPTTANADNAQILGITGTGPAYTLTLKRGYGGNQTAHASGVAVSISDWIHMGTLAWPVIAPVAEAAFRAVAANVAPVMVSSTVTGTSLEPAGTVAFYLDGSSTAAASGTVNSNGVATGLLTGLSIGLHSVTATYTSSNGYPTATTSVSSSFTVNKANPTLAWATPAAITYGTALSGTQLKATATGVSGATLPGTFTYSPLSGTVLTAGARTLSVSFVPTDTTDYTTPATTTVQLQVNKATSSVTTWPTASSITYGQTLASSTLTGGVSTPAGSFAFTTPTTAPGVGTASQSVIFTPTDTTDYITLTGTAGVTVNKASTTTTLTSSLNPSGLGQSVTLTATITGQYGGTATGTVTFSIGSTSLGSVSLSGGSASLATTTLPVGTDSITAVYGGDSNYAGSTSNTVSQVINNPAPFAGSISPAFASAGGAAFTLTVTGSGFVSGSTVYWGTSALTTTYGSATQLTAQVPATDIASAGNTAVTVQTPSSSGGTPNALQFEVDSIGSGSTPPTFTTLTATVTAGSPASYPVTLPSTVESASVTCLNLPTGATCSYSATTNKVTIATTSTTPKGTYQITVVFTETVSGAATSWILLPILLLPLVFLRRKLMKRGIWVTACLGMVLLAAAACTAGCGGGGSSTTTPPPQTHQVISSGSVSITIQ